MVNKPPLRPYGSLKAKSVAGFSVKEDERGKLWRESRLVEGWIVPWNIGIGTP